jgi:aminopeptidase N
MKYILYSFLFLFFISCDKKQEQLTLETGISHNLAKYRKQQIGDVVYTLNFKIPEEKTSPIPSNLELNFTVND